VDTGTYDAFMDEVCECSCHRRLDYTQEDADDWGNPYQMTDCPHCEELVDRSDVQPCPHCGAMMCGVCRKEHADQQWSKP
jgi:hypothetical protein